MCCYFFLRVCRYIRFQLHLEIIDCLCVTGLREKGNHKRECQDENSSHKPPFSRPFRSESIDVQDQQTKLNDVLRENSAVGLLRDLGLFSAPSPKREITRSV